MSSGVRFTVAVIVVAMFAVGLYYFRLEKPTEPPLDDVARTAEPSSLGVDVVESSAAPIVREPEPTPPPAPDSTDELNAAPAEAMTEPSETPGLEASTEPPADEISLASDTPPADAVADAEKKVALTGLARAYGPSLGFRETGVSLLSAVPSDDPRIDQGVARSNLANTVDAAKTAGPEGTIWLPFASWSTIEGTGEVEGVIVGTRGSGDTEQRFLLVRDDLAGGLRLDGRIAETSVREDTEGRPEVAYLLEADAVKSVEESTFDLIGGTVAWIVDGEIISTPTLRIAIQNRGHIAGSFNREDAAWIAARLRGELMTRPGAVIEVPNVEAEIAEAPSASGLPAEAYTPYAIQPGDNFERIAMEWFGDPQKQSLIALANPTVDPLRLQPGQIIKLPPKNSTSTIRRGVPAAGGEIVHTVQSGETLSDIALEYLGKASRWREIHDANMAIIGDDPGNLKVGMEIVIP
jgi:nucleoid-associated protein YgaU